MLKDVTMLRDTVCSHGTSKPRGRVAEHKSQAVAPEQASHLIYPFEGEGQASESKDAETQRQVGDAVQLNLGTNHL